jgi:DNA repair exonuclease SbcCD ATPase subunit
VFQNDLSVEITELGRDLDFHNLSRGESNRLTLGLSWAFRDLWESLNDTINVMFVDELIDSGMDSQGVESALEVLKKSSRERNRNVFLISHREELMSRVSQVLVVQKENGFTTFSNDFESVEGA